MEMPFPKEWFTKCDLWISVTSITWELFLFKHCYAGVLTVRGSSTSFSSCCCLLELENHFSRGYCCERVQELTFKKQLEQKMLSGSWQIISCSKQRWTWESQSDLVCFMVDISLQLLGLVLWAAHMKGPKLFWAHYVLFSVKSGSTFYFRRMVFFLFR